MCEVWTRTAFEGQVPDVPEGVQRCLVGEESKVSCRLLHCESREVAQPQASGPGRHLARFANQENIRVRNAAYRAANREKIRAYDAAYQAAHPERVRARVNTYRAAHPDRIAARRAADSEKLNEYAARRRARKANAPVVEKVSRAEVWKRDNGICHICKRKADPNDWHLEHIVPLAFGGEHSCRNVAVSHPFCNMSKGVRGTAQPNAVCGERADSGIIRRAVSTGHCDPGADTPKRPRQVAAANSPRRRALAGYGPRCTQKCPGDKSPRGLLTG